MDTLEKNIKIIHAQQSGLKLNTLLKHTQKIEKVLSERGAILLRGLNVRSSKQFGNLMETMFGGPLLSYNYRSTPRTELKSNVYTSTEYPAEQYIPQHNENSYTDQWPMVIGFCCLVEPERGGATPICCSQKVYRELPDEIVKKFEHKQLKYVRNFSEIDLSWQVAFQTNDKAKVQALCEQRNIGFEWVSKQHLRTYQILPATRVHPATGEKLWFNQAHLFHISSLPNDVQSNLSKQMSEEMYPRNVYFADHSQIALEDLQEIRRVYDCYTVSEPWKKGDIMLLDNMRYTHGREPYSGARKVLVGMSGTSPWSLINKKKNNGLDFP